MSPPHAICEKGHRCCPRLPGTNATSPAPATASPFCWTPSFSAQSRWPWHAGQAW